MRERTLRTVLLGAILAPVLGACTVGAPPGFSEGDSWAFPLVGPLEGGPLLVPVSIHDRGPYLFLIDADSPMSQLDVALANELDLRTGYGPDFVDETDQARPTRVAEVLRVTIGSLTVRSRNFLLTDIGAFDTAGRQVRGVLGRDVIADSLVFGFDRDRGMAYLATQQGFQRPAGATTLGYELDRSEIGVGLRAVSRRIATARIGGREVQLHVDLGGVASQLRPELWDDVGATPVDVRLAVVDEVGTRREVTRGALAGPVEAGGVNVPELLLVPYDDRRWDEQHVDGALGLGFFADHVVWANWDEDRLYLVPRTGEDLTRARIDRWGNAALSACAEPACTRAAVSAVDAAAAAPGATPILTVERSREVADRPFEVLIEATGAPDLPRIVAVFPVGVTAILQPIDPAFAGASLRVVDVSPFTRTCPGDTGCAYLLAEAR